MAQGSNYESLNEENNIEVILKKFEEENLIYTKGNNIVSSKIVSEEHYNRIVQMQNGKDYYFPCDNEIKAYCLGQWIDKTEEYQSVYLSLYRERKDFEQSEEMLEEIAENIVTKEWAIPQIMNCLFQWDVAFDSPQSARRMTKALSEWIYSIRRWSECGYSRKEKHLPNDQEEYIAYEGNSNHEQYTATTKVYPNDPCPCGSGKKYKKCCGK